MLIEYRNPASPETLEALLHEGRLGDVGDLARHKRFRRRFKRATRKVTAVVKKIIPKEIRKVAKELDPIRNLKRAQKEVERTAARIKKEVEREQRKIKKEAKRTAARIQKEAERVVSAVKKVLGAEGLSFAEIAEQMGLAGAVALQERAARPWISKLEAHALLQSATSARGRLGFVMTALSIAFKVGGAIGGKKTQERAEKLETEAKKLTALLNAEMNRAVKLLAAAGDPEAMALLQAQSGETAKTVSLTVAVGAAAAAVVAGGAALAIGLRGFDPKTAAGDDFGLPEIKQLRALVREIGDRNNTLEASQAQAPAAGLSGLGIHPTAEPFSVAPAPAATILAVTGQAPAAVSVVTGPITPDEALLRQWLEQNQLELIPQLQFLEQDARDVRLEAVREGNTKAAAWADAVQRFWLIGLQLMRNPEQARPDEELVFMRRMAKAVNDNVNRKFAQHIAWWKVMDPDGPQIAALEEGLAKKQQLLGLLNQVGGGSGLKGLVVAFLAIPAWLWVAGAVAGSVGGSFAYLKVSGDQADFVKEQRLREETQLARENPAAFAQLLAIRKKAEKIEKPGALSNLVVQLETGFAVVLWILALTGLAIVVPPIFRTFVGARRATKRFGEEFPSKARRAEREEKQRDRDRGGQQQQRQQSGRQTQRLGA